MEQHRWYNQTTGKAQWGRGPWTNEPDKAQGVDDATGYPWLIVRGPMGSLCGYVGVPEGHPWYEVAYREIDADVHGGLTYSDHCSPKEDIDRLGIGRSICHIVHDDEHEDAWWVGFDCGHAFDLMPGLRFTLNKIKKEAVAGRTFWQKVKAWFRSEDELDPPWKDVYRNWDYVHEEIKHLAEQAKEADVAEEA